MVYIAANCYAAIGVIDFPERWLPDADKALQTTLEQGARLRLHEHWQTFSDLFFTPDTWNPEAPAAVEILASVVTRWSGAREHLRDVRPDFHESLLQIDVHPVVSEVARRHWP